MQFIDSGKMYLSRTSFTIINTKGITVTFPYNNLIKNFDIICGYSKINTITKKYVSFIDKYYYCIECC